MTARRALPLLTNAEAAAILKMEPRALERLRGRKDGPAWTYVGRGVRYSHASIAAYLAARAKGTRR